jgi:4-amino-4-deoxy-L-arabinose transferase-like glycosyltransferase
MEVSGREQSAVRGDLTVLAGMALAVVVLHTLTNGQYGTHRDELQLLDDARHLDWGFVAYPPFTPFVERVSMVLFGSSLAGLRLFSAMAQGLVIFLGGWMARELGGKRFAQVVAALAVAVAPLVIFEGTEFQYSSFDLLCWVLIAYSTIRLLKSDDPRWWVAIGAMIGLGMMTKYSMAFFIAGIVGSVLLTRARRYLKNPWLWCGVGAALIAFLPNLIWQIHHHFVSVDFLRHIHSRDVSIGRTSGFVRDQFLACTNPFSVPIWLAGLCYYLLAKSGTRYRMLGWMYVITFAVFFISKGRGYYLGPAYPTLFAAGAVVEERWVTALAAWASWFARALTFAALATGGVIAAAIIVPILPVDSPKNIAIKANGDLREEIGWKELVATVAGIRDSLPPTERETLGILATNYGEAGAIDYYGPAYGLPQAISGMNSMWQRGYGEPPPQTLIVLGLSRPFVESHFQGCRVAGQTSNPYGIKNEETREHPDIYVCGPPLQPWPAFWKYFRYFG